MAHVEPRVHPSRGPAVSLASRQSFPEGPSTQIALAVNCEGPLREIIGLLYKAGAELIRS